jgi:uncharacterized coiled-coil protein SlyX
MKMVEKLQTTELASTSKQVKFSPKNDAINIMVYEYLKHHKMFYTSSVFASECLSIQQSSTEYLDNCEWKDILNSLGVTIPEDCDNVRAINDGKTCLLNWVVDTFGKKSSKTYENKSCQCTDNCSKTLMLNAQSQTVDIDEKILNTQFVQTLPTVSLVETQTDEDFLAFQRMSTGGLNEEIANLKKKLEKSQSTLKLCQLKLQESEDKIDYLLNHKNDPVISEDNALSKIQPPPLLTHPNMRKRVVCQKRIREAFNFLNRLDGRLQFLDQKYQSVTAQKHSYDNLRFLPDSSISQT